jgi:hypothetical protein
MTTSPFIFLLGYTGHLCIRRKKKVSDIPVLSRDVTLPKLSLE